MTLRLLFLAASMGGAFVSPFACGVAGAATLSNGVLTVTTADSSTGYSAKNTDRVDALYWVNSAGVKSGNLAVRSDGYTCGGDPWEFFGEAFSADAGLRFVGAGTVSKWASKSGTQATATTKSVNGGCYAPVGISTTVYKLSTKASQINALKITRTFSLEAGGTWPTAGSLKAYVPRLALTQYPVTLVPNKKGVIKSYDTAACNDGCDVSNWNGSWVALDDGKGNGMVIIRDSTATLPAHVVVDNDDYSGSNLSSIALELPASGGSEALQETEWLCIYDSSSWPSKKRSAGKLPQGCDI